MNAQADLFEQSARARTLRDAGMQTAIDHADAVLDAWSERAFAALRRYVGDVHTGASFTCETVRAYAETQGLPPPPDNRAWGGVMMRGARAGLYRKGTYAPATDPTSHCGPVTVWVRS